MFDMANKPLLFAIAAIIGLISLAISSTIPASAPGEAMGGLDEAASDAPADAAVEAAAPKAASMDEQLSGTWVQAARGGEDGKTRCDDAELMTTLNGGSTDTVHYKRDGTMDAILWYDTELKDVNGSPEIKAAYNSGTWNNDGPRLYQHYTGGTMGGGIDDQGESERQSDISINGNVMTQTYKDITTRYVRCR